MIYGYARVSTDGQSVAAQVRHSTEAGAAKVFRETESGARSDRPQLKKGIDALDAGDVLIVTSLDRLARSTRGLLFVLDHITAVDARFRSLGETWADTTMPQGRLTATVFAAFAEFERHLIRQRTSEGRKRAKRDGVRFGPKPILTSHQREETRRRLAAGKEAVVTIVRSYNVSQWTIQRLA